MTRPAGSQYFEVACAGWSDEICDGDDLTDPSAEWGCGGGLIDFGTVILGADGTAIGTGKQNTADIVNPDTGCPTSGIAARLANDLTLGGQTDWFLPSQEELNALCKWAFNDTVYTICNNNGPGTLSLTDDGFLSDAYWSSSEFNDSFAWAHYLDNGYQYCTVKYARCYVRPVRAF